MLILGQKSCFLGPTIFEIPQPNWYYCTSIATRLFYLIVSILDLGKCKIKERWIKKSYYWKETTEGFERNKDTPHLLYLLWANSLVLIYNGSLTTLSDVIFRLFSMRDLQICNTKITKITPIIFVSVLFLLYFEF